MFISPQVFSFPDSVEPVKCRGTPIWTLTPIIPGIQARRGCVFAAVVERDFWKPVWGTEDPSGKGIVLRRGSWGKGFIQLQCSNLRVGSGNREKVFLSTACEICALTQHLWTHAWLTKEKAMQKEMSKRRTKGKELFWLCKTLGSRAGSLGSSYETGPWGWEFSHQHRLCSASPSSPADKPLSGLKGYRLCNALHIKPAIIAIIRCDGVWLIASVTWQSSNELLMREMNLTTAEAGDH